MHHDDIRQALVIGLLCMLWYTTSSINNVVGKIILTDFAYPFTISLAQLLSVVIYSEPLLRVLKLNNRKVEFSWNYYFCYVLPLGMGKFIAITFSLVSIWKVPVSYAHTVKATMPLFTVFLSRLCLGECQSYMVYLSLIPILLGVAIASITELSFDGYGLAAALFSTATFSLLQIYSKKVMRDSGIHHFQLLHLLGKLGLVMFLPVWVLYDGFSLIKFKESHQYSDINMVRILTLIVIDGALSWFQNVISFRVLSLLSPLSYSVANATKRIAVITVSLLVLNNPVSFANVLGMLIAVSGVFAYNKVKYDEKLRLQKAHSSPLCHVVVDKWPKGPSPLSQYSEKLLDYYYGPPLQAASSTYWPKSAHAS